MGNYGKTKADDVDAALEQLVGHFGGEGGVAEHDGKDRVLAGFDREARSFEGRAQFLGVGGEAIAPAGTPVLNPAFDVTPARLLTGLITERGICRPSAESLAEMFPEHQA